MDHIVFLEADERDADVMYQLVVDRIQWMDEKGIKQWNVTHYTDVYPLAYYRSEAKSHRVYVLKQDEAVIAGAILLENDARWRDLTPALYVHNFVSQRGTHAGHRLMQEVMAYAKEKQKHYVRLDCARDNLPLQHYYESLGFVRVGTCQEGPYRGYLYEKALSQGK